MSQIPRCSDVFKSMQQTIQRVQESGFRGVRSRHAALFKTCLMRRDLEVDALCLMWGDSDVKKSSELLPDTVRERMHRHGVPHVANWLAVVTHLEHHQLRQLLCL